MISGTVRELTQLLEGRSNQRDAAWRGVSTDSRSIQSQALFVALDGPNFEGRDFVGAAAAKGAGAAVVTQYADADIAQVAVPDTRHALGVLAADWRSRLPVTVIGVTGSNGKTTVKQMLAASLGAAAHATRGNLNNDIGVPLTLLELTAEHRLAVIEMGANHAGEIAYLASLVRPDIAIVTNAGPSHLEGFGSLDGVANAKGELFYSLGQDGVAVINRDDVYFDRWAALAEPARIVTFGATDEADAYPSDIEFSTAGSSFMLHIAGESAEVVLPLVGAHNVLNACAAALAAHSAGIALADIAQRLASVSGADARLETYRLAGERLLVDDSYNANPASMLAAAEYALSLGRPVTMALGDMGELGQEAATAHKTLGETLAMRGVQTIHCTGELMRHLAEGFGDAARWHSNKDALSQALSASLAPGSVIVVKGSRSAGMEAVTQALQAQFGEVANA